MSRPSTAPRAESRGCGEDLAVIGVELRQTAQDRDESLGSEAAAAPVQQSPQTASDGLQEASVVEQHPAEAAHTEASSAASMRPARCRRLGARRTISGKLRTSAAEAGAGGALLPSERLPALLPSERSLELRDSPEETSSPESIHSVARPFAAARRSRLLAGVLEPRAAATPFRARGPAGSADAVAGALEAEAEALARSCVAGRSRGLAAQRLGPIIAGQAGGGATAVGG
eukprot:CAMPEP_0175787164 /NCGR_PEP_ID=MMETSP0097-20121207/80210_1 /TAXON_ID=311494 /ORGANISM="Alexandrium monilatum, Strain CCMP3105" /LENGTH=229 /DNA_ID=CAMNT_0017098113 /DNA_START=284 /DNA_END=974 /DNA_ORIENTATION=+